MPENERFFAERSSSYLIWKYPTEQDNFKLIRQFDSYFIGYDERMGLIEIDNQNKKPAKQKTGKTNKTTGKEKGRAGGDAQPLIPNAAMGGGGAAFNLLDLGGGVIQQEVKYCISRRTTTHNYA